LKMGSYIDFDRGQISNRRFQKELIKKSPLPSGNGDFYSKEFYRNKQILSKLSSGKQVENKKYFRAIFHTASLTSVI